MTITIETANLAEAQKLLEFMQSLHIEAVHVVTDAPRIPPHAITRGDKSIDPTTLFGIWKDAPRSLEKIRETNWERNWNL